MKIKTTRLFGRDLKAGDLFSTAGQDYWDGVNANLKGSIGEKVYIRTKEVCPIGQEEEIVYKLTIEK